MNIVFICGCIEPGRDGVGDYTQRLSAELVESGHTCGIIALNDPYISGSFDSIIITNHNAIKVLRYSSLKIAIQHKQTIYGWLNLFHADIVSLQFVPFAFHPKGLPFQLAAFLSELVMQKALHIMFHELWVGMNVNASFKEKCWGVVQRQLIRLLVYKLKPAVIHTQTHLYQQQLSRLSIQSNLLPLFGNISVFNENGLKKDTDKIKNNELRLVLFGGIHPGSPFRQFAEDAQQYAKLKNLDINLTLLGRCGHLQDEFAEIWKSLWMVVTIEGEQSPEYISRILARSTVGITTTPLMLLEKSGTVAAMLEHRVPVICLPQKWATSFNAKATIPGGIIAYSSQQKNIDDCLQPKHDAFGLSINSVSRVARQFLNDLPVR